MAVLTDVQRKAAWRAFISERLGADECRWTKADLVAAVDAMNTWLDNNQASLVVALNAGAPNFGGANSTTAQKAWLFIYVVMVRQGLI